MLRPAGEAGALPDAAVAQRRQRRIVQGVAAADRLRPASGGHLERPAPIAVATRRLARTGVDLHHVAAERGRSVEIVHLAEDVLRRGLKAVLRVGAARGEEEG